MPARRRVWLSARSPRTEPDVTPDTAIPAPESRRATRAARSPTSLYACLYQPPSPDVCGDAPRPTLELIAREFSPRYERHHDTLVSIDVSGLERMVGRRPNNTDRTTSQLDLRVPRDRRGPLDSARVIGEALRREAASRGVRVHVAVAGTRMAALVLAHARPGISLVAPGDQAGALAAVPIGVLSSLIKIAGEDPIVNVARGDDGLLTTFKRWGLKTLGDLAALPRADLTARLGRQALVWQAIARGEDVRPLVPTLDEERFESSFDLDWPIDGLEPLSFVLTRLLEPLSTRLERRDRGTAVLHVVLRLVTREPYARRLELPSPMRDVRTLRMLALLDLESHPPDAAIDRVSVIIDPTPGRILQHTLFTRAQPTPEQLSTLLARLGALMGRDRLGAPAVVDSYRPGAFAMVSFATDHDDRPGTRGARQECDPQNAASAAGSALNAMTNIVSALRRCRHPVPARVAVDAVDGGRPVRVTTDRRGFAGGTVIRCVGPWRSSGNWWIENADGAGEAGGAGGSGTTSTSAKNARSTDQPHPPDPTCWNRDEWDVALNDGAVYRIFQDRDTGAWFIDAIVD
jgi:protein ImuB